MLGGCNDIETEEARQAIVKKIVKNVACTKDGGDVLNGVNNTLFFDRLRHVMQYSHRIFTFQMPLSGMREIRKPQYTGRKQKRVEWKYPDIIGDSRMSKRMPTAANSPSRWTARSKLGTGLRYAIPPKSRPSSSSTTHLHNV